jgi:hypothetical protein
MTLRLVMQAEKGGTAIALHGWLAGPEVAEFARITAEALPPLRIDLAQLAGADAPGIAALQAECDRGVRLVNVSPYIRLLLASADPPGAPERKQRARKRGVPHG